MNEVDERPPDAHLQRLMKRSIHEKFPDMLSDRVSFPTEMHLDSPEPEPT
jgi:hypothetical protein